MLRKIGRFSARAFASASGPHGYQSTGLCACCRKYGLVSWIRRFAVAIGRSPASTLLRKRVHWYLHRLPWRGGRLTKLIESTASFGFKVSLAAILTHPGRDLFDQG